MEVQCRSFYVGYLLNQHGEDEINDQWSLGYPPELRLANPTGPRKYTARVQYPVPFSSAPSVLLWCYGIDDDVRASGKLQLSLAKIALPTDPPELSDPKGYLAVEVSTDGDSLIYKVYVGWLAVSF